MWQTQCLVNIEAKSSERSFLLQISLSPLIVTVLKGNIKTPAFSSFPTKSTFI